MATAIKSEATKPEESKADEPEPYKMPRPDRGQMVLFYPTGIPNNVTMVIGCVNKASTRNVEMNVNGMLREGVRHVSDPLLKTNMHARSFGAWDFTERDKHLADLEQRVAKLESLLK